MIEEKNQKLEDPIQKLAEQREEAEVSLRPKNLGEYIGQTIIKNNLEILLKAAQGRGDTLEHMLFYGPPGLGKTTIAHIVAREMGVNIRVTSGPAIERAGDLAALLTNLSENDVLFIDEIHRLSKNVEEILYPAMEDRVLDIIIGKGPAARSIRMELPHFTLIGATTRFGAISSPLRDRFGAVFKLEYYEPDELASIITRSADILNSDIDETAAIELAKRSRFTPRIANRLLKRARDYMQVSGNDKITTEHVGSALDLLDIDELGLDKHDRAVLEVIIDKFGGGPVGINTLAMASAEEVSTVEEVYEPFLIRLGLIMRTPKGRVVTEQGYKHVNRNYPKNTLL